MVRMTLSRLLSKSRSSSAVERLPSWKTHCEVPMGNHLSMEVEKGQFFISTYIHTYINIWHMHGNLPPFFPEIPLFHLRDHLIVVQELPGFQSVGTSRRSWTVSVYKHIKNNSWDSDASPLFIHIYICVYLLLTSKPYSPAWNHEPAPSFNGHDTIEEFHLRIPGDAFEGASDVGDH